MDRINSSGYVIKVSTSLTNSTGVPTPAPKTIIASTLFMSFIIGTISNGLSLWMLKFKMQRTVNTLLFFQITLSYFISTLILPLMATSFLQDNHWAFGSVLCKVFNSTLSVSMFASVFLLCAISGDRYHLILHPVWSQQHRTPCWASRTALRIWISATVLSIPYLVFRKTHDGRKGRIKCQNDDMCLLPGRVKSIRHQGSESMQPVSSDASCWVSFCLSLSSSFATNEWLPNEREGTL